VPHEKPGEGFFRLDPLQANRYPTVMKSCLGLLVTLLIFTLVVGGGALVWYLSHSAEFSRSDAPAVRAPAKR
jgi:hypothetical protein